LTRRLKEITLKETLRVKMRSKRPSRMSDLLLLSTTLVLPTEMKRMKLFSSRITRIKLFSYSRDSFVDVLSRIACSKAKKRDLI